jgi:hypothetical protein
MRVEEIMYIHSILADTQLPVIRKIEFIQSNYDLPRLWNESSDENLELYLDPVIKGYLRDIHKFVEKNFDKSEYEVRHK